MEILSIRYLSSTPSESDKIYLGYKDENADLKFYIKCEGESGYDWTLIASYKATDSYVDVRARIETEYALIHAHRLNEPLCVIVHLLMDNLAEAADASILTKEGIIPPEEVAAKMAELLLFEI